ncbi:MAG: hypothetical protein LUD38_16070 [Parabacteroides sp.]|nr:hypothetical protein [Parabacteroides sp.]
MKMPKLFFLICLSVLVANSPSFAFGGWQSATNTGQAQTGDPMLMQCFYRTIQGYEFSITHRGLCPFTVQLNPESGQYQTNTPPSMPSPYSGSSAGRWESATLAGDAPTGDIMLKRCFYKTLGGYSFSTVRRGICPFTVQVNPETGQYR